MSARMHRWRSDDVSAVSLEIETFGKLSAPERSVAQSGEVVVPSTPTRRASERVRKGAVGVFELAQAEVPTVSRIDIEHDKHGRRSGRDRHVRERLLLPPTQHK